MNWGLRSFVKRRYYVHDVGILVLSDCTPKALRARSPTRRSEGKPEGSSGDSILLPFLGGGLQVKKRLQVKPVQKNNLGRHEACTCSPIPFSDWPVAPSREMMTLASSPPRANHKTVRVSRLHASCERVWTWWRLKPRLRV